MARLFCFQTGKSGVVIVDKSLLPGLNREHLCFPWILNVFVHYDLLHAPAFLELKGMSLLILAELSACTGFLLLKSTLQDPVVGLSGVKISSCRLRHIWVSYKLHIWTIKESEHYFCTAAALAKTLYLMNFQTWDGRLKWFCFEYIEVVLSVWMWTLVNHAVCKYVMFISFSLVELFCVVLMEQK